MNISGIRISAGFYDYNIIKNREQAEPKEVEPKEAQAVSPAAESEQTQKESASVISLPAKSEPDQGAVDYAKRYQPDVTYELKGADSDINNLDVEKALSDMRKDQVLQQYQFFVGTEQTRPGENREDENFYL